MGGRVRTGQNHKEMISWSDKRLCLFLIYERFGGWINFNFSIQNGFMINHRLSSFYLNFGRRFVTFKIADLNMWRVLNIKKHNF